MFSGGSGITPFISVVRELLHMASDPSNKTPQIILIPAFKKSVDLGILDLLLPVTGTSHDISRIRLQIQAYVTQESRPTAEDQKVYQTIWFKPSPLDAPISAILGVNSWLWLWGIILGSSVVFLTLVAIITQFYIYPIDHNTNVIYSYSARSTFNMLSICISVVITVVIAFYWNKKGNLTETRQVQMTDVPTPMTSPGISSWYYNADCELESLPNKSFAGSTKVSYGERPDFKSKNTRFSSEYNT